jgi:branched-subunit amino acid ABC-type transport system permease component
VHQLFLAIGFGLATASIIAMAAVAVSLQISVMNFVNFAYGDFMTVGAYFAWYSYVHGVPFVLAVVFGAIATGLLGIGANRFVFRPLQRRKMRPVTLLIAGLGLSFAIENALTVVWSSEPHRIGISLGRSLHIGPFLLSVGDIVMIVSAVVLLTLLHLMLAQTKFGKSLRATSNNADLAEACGINTDGIVVATWFIAGLLTGIAGVGLALQENSLDPGLGFTQLFVIFGAVILGGIGRPYGAMLGALAVGELTEIFGIYFSSGYKTTIAFGVVIIVLLFRPQGIFATAGKTG